MARADRSLPDVALGRAVLDRRAELRTDPDLLTRLLADPSTRVARLDGDRMPVLDDGRAAHVALTAPAEGDGDGLVVYLGEHDGTSYVGVVRPAEDVGDAEATDTPSGDPVPMTLRQCGARLDDVSSAVFATTLALANWHRVHTHCPRCGSPTAPVLAGWVRRCPADGSEHYPRTDVAIIVAVVDDADRILLARGTGFRTKGMSVLAGFLEPGETLEAAVQREVLEEVGVRVTDVEYLGDQPWPFPSGLMVGFRARALGTDLVLQDDEIAEARWFSREGLVAAVAEGSLVVPGSLSIARRLVEHWFGGPLAAPEVVSLR